MKSVLFSLSLLVATSFTMMAFTGDATKKKLPSVMLTQLNGKKFDISKIDNNGKPIIINIWATWCSPCKRELNAIHDLYEDWVEETGVKLIAISMDDSRNMRKVKPYVDSKGWEYECYIDPNSDFVRAMNVVNPPQSYILNKDKEIVYAHNGYAPGDEQILYKKVKELAGQK